ncbi:MAG: response regulator [Gammaproteobacteria bacterium]|nr:response regulator [Gammaproteobacteria bacterium]
MNKTPHILVVDDDHEIRDLLRTYLEQNQLRVTTVRDGVEMWKQLDLDQFDLIVLDLMLPGDDGLTLCRNLRSNSRLPVIMLTARGDEMDRILGLEMGADDYLPKPFNPRELLARIKAVLLRAKSDPVDQSELKGQFILFAEWTLDTVSRHLISSDGVVVPLSSSEYRLLKVLLSHANRVLSRDQLMDMTRGRDADPFDRSIDVQIGRLRRRLGDDAKSPTLIKTIRGEGYLLTAKVTQKR